MTTQRDTRPSARDAGAPDSDAGATPGFAGDAGSQGVDRPATGATARRVDAAAPANADAGGTTDAGARADWRTPDIDELCDALLTLRTRDEAAAFLRDLCSLHELETLAHRMHAARLLDRGLPYARVAEQVRGSTATVTRVAHWLKHGEGGYRLVLDRLGRR
jgi:TrpR-related protein YerC/YecD